MLTVCLVAGLLLAACQTSDRLRRDYLERMRPLLPAPERPVIVIPGFGVSRLRDPVLDQWVWGTPRTTVITSYEEDLDLSSGGSGAISRDRLEPSGFVGSRGPVNTAWQLAIALQKYGGYTIARWSEGGTEPPTAYLFEHDWRLSAIDTAERLDELVETVRREHRNPELQVDLLTHSAGSNVALAYLHQFPGASAKVGSLVMVAPPRRGTLEAFKLLVRGEQVIRRRFDPVMAATWPSVFEVLPHDPIMLIHPDGRKEEADLHDPEIWRDLEIGLFDPATRMLFEHEQDWSKRIDSFERELDRAESFRRMMLTPVPSGVKVLTVLGDCVPTVDRLLVRSDRSFVFYPDELLPEERDLLSELFAPGDGTVAASSATPLDGEDELILCSGHQGLATDPATHRAIIRALLE
ncbi:MAG: hypothetical protein R3338_00200 [Thermoanaerobaculia bacterium]|nr:hypothetical protein [Thermoanaerobaculia bacterium]